MFLFAVVAEALAVIGEQEHQLRGRRRPRARSRSRRSPTGRIRRRHLAVVLSFRSGRPRGSGGAWRRVGLVQVDEQEEGFDGSRGSTQRHASRTVAGAARSSSPRVAPVVTSIASS